MQSYLPRPGPMKLAILILATYMLTPPVWSEVYRVWDTILITTSKPPGSGYAEWRCPEPIPIDADEYACTSAVHAVGYLLTSPTMIDVGVVAYNTNVGPAISFPHVLLNQSVTQAITQPLNAWYTLRFFAALHSNGYVTVHLSDYQSYGGTPPNTSLALPSRIEMRGYVRDGLGTSVTAIPESAASLSLLSLLLSLHPRGPRSCFD